MNRRFATLAFVACATVASSASADERDFPCDGCVVVGERGGAPKPLVVVLHGDEGGPSRVASVWTSVAKKRGVVAFLPKCPRTEGCTTGSFWRWNGEPSWLLAQVSTLEAAYGVDAKRRYIAGWSGGTTYLTFRFASWFPTFAAVSLTGGGARGGSGCFPGAGGGCGDVLYRMGDRNPLFDLAERARSEIEACGHAVEWKVLPGLDHEGEWAAYVRDAEGVLDWLLAREEGCAEVAMAVPSAAPSAQPMTTPTTSAATVQTTTSGAPPPAPRCHCGVVGAESAWEGTLLGVVVMAGWIGRRRAAAGAAGMRAQGACRYIA